MATSATAPKFEDRDIELIAASLPDWADQHRRELLPRILREWSRTDLKHHLSRESRMIIRVREMQQKLVGKCARALLQALDGLDDRGRTQIALAMVRVQPPTAWSMDEIKLAGADKRLYDERDFLARLVAAAPRATLTQGRGRPRNIAACLIMQDAAAIFEWLIRRSATRIVDRIEHTETGPFWQFTAALNTLRRGRSGSSPRPCGQ